MTIKTYIHITEKRLGTDCLSVLAQKIKKEMVKFDFPKLTPFDEGYNLAVQRLNKLL